MAYKEVDPGLRNRVDAAVDLAIARGGDVSRSTIVAQFATAGVNQSTLFRWIDKRMKQADADAVVGRAKPIPHKASSPSQKAEAESAPAPALGRVADAARGEGIDYVRIIQDNLRDLHAGLAMAKTDDGKIKNPRLMLACVDQIGKQLSHASRVQVALSLDASQRIDQFMDELVDLVMQEIPARRDYILGRMDTLRLHYGSRA
jgi:hypothetical protein